MGGDNGPKTQLAKIMLQQKLVTPDQLPELGAERQPSPSGQISVPQALATLAQQHGVPPADVTRMVDVVAPTPSTNWS